MFSPFAPEQLRDNYTIAALSPADYGPLSGLRWRSLRPGFHVVI
jgi:hypothetical protein